MTISSINSLNVFKKSVFKHTDADKCPCGEKKAAPIRPFSNELLKDTFELQCCGKKR